MEEIKPTEKADETKDIVLAGSQPNIDRIVREHVLWSMGAGLIPIPLFDIAAVTAIQMDALQKLAGEEGIDYSTDSGKRFVAALTGGTFARFGASLIKGIPGIGTVIGGLSMSAMSAASTYAICQAALHQFRSERNLLSFNLDDAKNLYERGLEQGKAFVKSLEGQFNPEAAKDIYKNLDKLKELREANILTEEEYEQKKSKLLSQL